MLVGVQNDSGMIPGWSVIHGELKATHNLEAPQIGWFSGAQVILQDYFSSVCSAHSRSPSTHLRMLLLFCFVFSWSQCCQWDFLSVTLSFFWSSFPTFDLVSFIWGAFVLARFSYVSVVSADVGSFRTDWPVSSTSRCLDRTSVFLGATSQI